MSSSKGGSFWGVYANETADGQNYIMGFPQFTISNQDWDAWHNEFVNTLPQGVETASMYDELTEYFLRKAIVGDVVEDPFTDQFLEEL